MDAMISHTASADQTILVIRTNDFTKRIDDGYLALHGNKVSGLMNAREVGKFIASNPSIKVELLRT